MKLLAALCFCGILLPSLASEEGDLVGKTLVFSVETDTSYVVIVPKKPLSLRAFTLCMHLATELSGEREVILFAYRTTDFDELNVWRELDGSLSFYLAGGGVIFQIPPPGALNTHLCVTWESSTGLSNFYLDGKRSVSKIYKRGHQVQAGGTVILGQDPDSFLGRFDSKQSFVGEIRDVNMWDYVLPTHMIQAQYSVNQLPRANIIDWDTVELNIKGDVSLVTYPA